ncbi:MAG: hypothetical protein JXQ71_11555 [Verrucomicrobia bacterium]|nr:hypothetical protein [Verrucomicrobiota bacterium]
MDQLRTLLDLARQHYEKLIVVLALLGLATTVWILNEVRRREVEKINHYLTGIDRSPNKPLPPLDMTPHEAALKLTEKPLSLDFSLPHNLFNPVKWQLQRDGQVLKIETGTEVGPPVLEFLEARPLHFIIAYDRVTGSGYTLVVTRENVETPRQRARIRTQAMVGLTNEFYTLLDVKGDPKQPTELVLQLKSQPDPVSVAPGKPFKRVDGYEADFKYPPEGRSFSNMRLQMTMRFAGEDYKIVSLSADEAVLSASSNNKTYTVRRKQP